MIDPCPLCIVAGNWIELVLYAAPIFIVLFVVGVVVPVLHWLYLKSKSGSWDWGIFFFVVWGVAVAVMLMVPV